MKVVIDELRCDAHGVCVDACPEVFALDDADDIVRVLIEEPDESLRPSLERAVQICPKAAIKIEDEEMSEALADRLAVTDVIVRYFELVDTKAWDRMHEVFTEDTTTRWNPETLVEGRDKVVGSIRHMIGSDEIVTYHHVASMAPVVDGDTAEVTARVRAMHHGVGPRTGKFYESFGVQPTTLVRTTDGWRIKHHEWNIAVMLGDRNELFAPEYAAGTPY